MNFLESYGLFLAGGAMVGLAASLVLFTHGRIAGISGLFAGLFLPGYDARSFRVWFIAGLAGAGVVLRILHPTAFTSTDVAPAAMVAVAGLLVGFGTRLGGGCTSGHGICGLCRFSARSLVATLTFMATGMITVFITRHVAGGGR
jgi:uncharacterized membrane protein YedE/YeeE